MVVRSGNEYSDPFTLERGVRQGCPTSPLLFDIFIDDILDDIQGISIPNSEETISGICFADDTLIFGNYIEDINKKIKSIEKWMGFNYMEVNTSKCGLLLTD